MKNENKAKLYKMVIDYTWEIELLMADHERTIKTITELGLNEEFVKSEHDKAKAAYQKLRNSVINKHINAIMRLVKEEPR